MSRPSLTEACTKIVATVGPACSTQEMLVQLIEAGVDVFRINTAHGDREQHELVLRDIRAASEQVGYPVGVLLDLAGPKIRLGELLTDPLECENGMKVSFVRGDEAAAETEFTSTYDRLIDELEVGDRVMLADGTVSLIVESVSADRADCRVTAGGSLRSRQGINLPGVKLSVSAMLPRRHRECHLGRRERDRSCQPFVRSYGRGCAGAQGLAQQLWIEGIGDCKD